MNGERLVHPIGQDHQEVRTRAELIEQWKRAPESLIRYEQGSNTDTRGNIYYHPRGTRLMILGEEVMDSCQTPWANATVDSAFEALSKRTDIKVLERGFGMGIVATRIRQYLEVTGGEYTCIELNEEVANYADTAWREKQESIQRTRAGSIPGQTYRDARHIEMNIIKGEAFEETAKLVADGKKFDIIISDTYPLSDEEKSVNDLLDLEQLIQCLAPNGVFAFFGFYTGSEGSMNVQQRNLIDRYFRSISTTMVDVRPPKDYKYFNPSTGTVTKLPVTICTNPVTRD